MLKEKVISALQAIDLKNMWDMNTDADSVLYVNGFEYKVFTDAEADAEFTKFMEDEIDESGLESFSPTTKKYIADNFIKQRFFDEEMQSYFNSETNTMSLQEQLEIAMTTTDNRRMDSIRWYKMMFGSEAFYNIIRDEGLVDCTQAIDWLLKTGDRSRLATFDKTERAMGEYFIYNMG